MPIPDNCVELPLRVNPGVVAQPGAGGADRRRRRRIQLRWSVELLVLDRTVSIQTNTRDMSSGGFYCWSPVQFAPGERVVGIIKAPAYDRTRPDGVLSIECRVRVARVEPPNQEGLYGLGCEISDYRLLCT